MENLLELANSGQLTDTQLDDLYGSQRRHWHRLREEKPHRKC